MSAVQRLGARRGARVTIESPSVDTDALCADLEALAHAHPEIAGTLHLAATTLAEQKAEIKLLSEQITVVKGALSHFLEGLGTAQALDSMLFQCGGLSTVTRVLEKLMSRAPVAALLPDHLKATDETVKTQAAIGRARIPARAHSPPGPAYGRER